MNRSEGRRNSGPEFPGVSGDYGKDQELRKSRAGAADAERTWAAQGIAAYAREGIDYPGPLSSRERCLQNKSRGDDPGDSARPPADADSGWKQLRRLESRSDA